MTPSNQGAGKEDVPTLRERVRKIIAAGPWKKELATEARRHLSEIGASQQEVPTRHVGPYPPFCMNLKTKDLQNCAFCKSLILKSAILACLGLAGAEVAGFGKEKREQAPLFEQSYLRDQCT